MCLAKMTHGQRKQKRKKKNNPFRRVKNKLSEQTPNPLQKFPGMMLQAKLRSGAGDNRGVLSLGNSPHPLPKEKSKSARRRFLRSYLRASTPTISAHNPKFPARKMNPDYLLSAHFSSATMTGTDVRVLSITTTVDNTIKMADRSFKQGRHDA